MRKLFGGVVAMIGVMILLCPAIAQVTTEEPSSPVIIRSIDGPKYYLSEVIKVVDGDTVDLRFKVWSDITLEKRIRFENINTWEVRGKDKDKGIAAQKFLIKLLSNGRVYLRTSGATEKYGRTLGSLYVITDGKIIDIEKELRDHGHETQNLTD